MVDDLYEITSGPTSEPVTLSEAKSWLRVTHSADDTLITGLITASRQFGEKFCNRIFGVTTIECYFSGITYSQCENFGFVQVRRSPLNSITSLELYSGGAYAASTDYDLKNINGFPRLIFQNGIEVDDDSIYPIKLTGNFGYSTVPEDLKTAVLSHIAFWYENRGDAVAEGKLSMPLETRSIYSGKYRILNSYG